MNKINKTKITYKTLLGLALLGILTFSTLSAKEANATHTSFRGYVGGTPVNDSYTAQAYYDAPAYYYPEPVYYNVPAPVTYSYKPYADPAPTVIYAPAPEPAIGNPDPTATVYSSTEAEEANKDIGDLAAAAVLGEENSYMPSGLVQWILFAILVLLAVILGRKVFGGAEKYFATPLKHD